MSAPRFVSFKPKESRRYDCARTLKQRTSPDRITRKEVNSRMSNMVYKPLSVEKTEIINCPKTTYRKYINGKKITVKAVSRKDLKKCVKC